MHGQSTNEIRVLMRQVSSWPNHTSGVQIKRRALEVLNRMAYASMYDRGEIKRRVEGLEIILRRNLVPLTMRKTIQRIVNLWYNG